MPWGAPHVSPPAVNTARPSLGRFGARPRTDEVGLAGSRLWRWSRRSHVRSVVSSLRTAESHIRDDNRDLRNAGIGERTRAITQTYARSPPLAPPEDAKRERPPTASSDQPDPRRWR